MYIAMSVKQTKINNKVVVATDLKNGITKPILGYELYPGSYGLYGNIALIAKKRSGKSTTLNYILHECVGRDTKLFIFCPTYNKDDEWCHILDWLDEEEIDYEVFKHIRDKKTNYFSDIVTDLDEKIDAKKEKDKMQKIQKHMVKKLPKFQMDLYGLKNSKSNYGYPDPEPKKKETKYIAPEYIFVFDDISSQLALPEIAAFMKANRHYKSKVIISTQDLKDIELDARAQIDFYHIFGRLSPDRLRSTYDESGVHISWDDFKNLYRIATKELYKFLYIDCRDDKYRKNFDIDFEI